MPPFEQGGIFSAQASAMCASAFGFNPGGGPITAIPREEWHAEIERCKAERATFRAAPLVKVELAVELPFWLMMDSCTLPTRYQAVAIEAEVNQNWGHVCDGPFYLHSQSNTIAIGPIETFRNTGLSHVNSPVYRPMRTVVSFGTHVLSSALDAWYRRHSISADDRPGIRAVNAASQYFSSLAYAHLPFVNEVILSYRTTSRDPFAFEVTEFSVPHWFIITDREPIAISIMPYWSFDEAPSIRSMDDDGSAATPFIATTGNAVASAMESSPTPGVRELLDAYSLMYRGMFNDAVRSVVTAIEVGLESALRRLLLANGLSAAEVDTDIARTHNSFFERLHQFEQESQKRVPGPVLSEIPYINGLRLDRELDTVRNLRHRIVHRGERIDAFSRGPVLRAIETMSWFFEWLNEDLAFTGATPPQYSFFNLLRGQFSTFVFRFDTTALELADEPSDEDVQFADDLLIQQFTDAVLGERPDIDLFVRMSLAYLGVECDDSPPPSQHSDLVCERYLAKVFGRELALISVQSDREVDVSLANKFTSRSPDAHSVWICRQPSALRQPTSVSSDVVALARSIGATFIDAVDLLRLVHGVVDRYWSQRDVLGILLTPGHQGSSPIGSSLAGAVVRIYSELKVISVELLANKSIGLEDTLYYRSGSRFIRMRLTSLQVQKSQREFVTGPCRVGVKCDQSVVDIREGDLVYLAAS